MDFDAEMVLVDTSVLDRLEKLEKFYHAVADLTLNHAVLGGEVGDEVLGETAVVYPSKLGPLLEQVDKEWWKLK